MIKSNFFLNAHTFMGYTLYDHIKKEWYTVEKGDLPKKTKGSKTQFIVHERESKRPRNVTVAEAKRMHTHKLQSHEAVNELFNALPDEGDPKYTEQRDAARQHALADAHYGPGVPYKREVVASAYDRVRKEHNHLTTLIGHMEDVDNRETQKAISKANTKAAAKAKAKAQKASAGGGDMSFMDDADQQGSTKTKKAAAKKRAESAAIKQEAKAEAEANLANLKAQQAGTAKAAAEQKAVTETAVRRSTAQAVVADAIGAATKNETKTRQLEKDAATVDPNTVINEGKEKPVSQELENKIAREVHPKGSSILGMHEERFNPGAGLGASLRQTQKETRYKAKHGVTPAQRQESAAKFLKGMGSNAKAKAAAHEEKRRAAHEDLMATASVAKHIEEQREEMERRGRADPRRSDAGAEWEHGDPSRRKGVEHYGGTDDEEEKEEYEHEEEKEEDDTGGDVPPRKGASGTDGSGILNLPPANPAINRGDAQQSPPGDGPDGGSDDEGGDDDDEGKDDPDTPLDEGGGGGGLQYAPNERTPETSLTGPQASQADMARSIKGLVHPVCARRIMKKKNMDFRAFYISYVKQHSTRINKTPLPALYQETVETVEQYKPTLRITRAKYNPAAGRRNVIREYIEVQILATLSEEVEEAGSEKMALALANSKMGLNTGDVMGEGKKLKDDNNKDPHARILADGTKEQGKAPVGSAAFFKQQSLPVKDPKQARLAKHTEADDEHGRAKDARGEIGMRMPAEPGLFDVRLMDNNLTRRADPGTVQQYFKLNTNDRHKQKSFRFLL